MNQTKIYDMRERAWWLDTTKGPVVIEQRSAFTTTGNKTGNLLLF
jgi:hypothetical protein